VASSFLDLSVAELLNEVASDRRSPGGGPVLALTLALAAGVVAMAARVSGTDWVDAADAAAQADALRLQAAALADRDAEAFERALAVLDAAEAIEPERRDEEIGRVFAAAAEPPLEIGEVARDVARLAAEAAVRADQRVRPDAIAAASLAAAVATGAAELVAVNLTATRTDERVVRARELAEDADRAARFAAFNYFAMAVSTTTLGG
jgi:methenyltetrahydrofolate cyclohydrolase